MAEVHLKSQVVTDLDASPVVKQNPVKAGGVLREQVATIETNADDSVGSTYRMLRVPSRARISELLISTNGASGDGTADIGLYLSDEGAAVDDDLFAASYAIKTKAAQDDITFLNETVNTFDGRNRRLYELAGETEDPNVMYDIALTVDEALTSTANLITLKARYVVEE